MPGIVVADRMGPSPNPSTPLRGVMRSGYLEGDRSDHEAKQELEAISPMNAARRTLSFDSLDQIMPDVDRLLLGHKTVGNWSLGQICNHLTGGIIGTVNGFPSRAPWLIRKTVGPLIRRRILNAGRFPEGIKLPERFAPKTGADARAEAEALRAAIRLLTAHSGPFAEHPLGGHIPRDEWERFHCIHCAHHLSFAWPTGPV
jgi:Protein of unknown function (DUF1569)